MNINNVKFIYVITVLQTIAIIFLFWVIFFPTENMLKKAYYDSEVATLVSPHSLREDILHNTVSYVIVDVREKDDYLRGHIIGAINIVPGPGMVEKFKELEKENLNKKILTYCYTQVCLRGRKVGRELADSGVYVKELGIGFNDWKNFWRQWNYESEWSGININEYIQTGETPGKFANPIEKDLLDSGCSADAKYSC